MRLSDKSIAQLVRTLQLALLTGTDVTDNFRMVEFIVVDNKIEPDPDYLQTFDENLSSLERKAEELQEATESGK